MTTFITVLTKPTTQANVFDVCWAAGPKSQGLLNVTLNCKTEDDEVAAELTALQYLLETSQVCGQNRTGNSLDIICSLGTVKKLAQGKSEKVSLADFALFLRTRFVDANVTISKDATIFNPDRLKGNRKAIAIDAPQLSTIKLPDGLRVAITHHALTAHMVRYQIPLAANAWRSLRAMMMHPGTKLENKTLEEESRHGKAVLAYANPEGLRLIVVLEPVGAKLLTCYYKHNLALRDMQMA